MTIKVRLPDNTIVTPSAIVVENIDGSTIDFHIDKIEEAIIYRKNIKRNAITKILEDHFYLRDSDYFVKSFISLQPNVKKQLLELLQDLNE